MKAQRSAAERCESGSGTKNQRESEKRDDRDQDREKD